MISFLPPNYTSFCNRIKLSIENYLALRYMWRGKNFYFRSRHVAKFFDLPSTVVGVTLKDHISDSVVSIYSRGSHEILWHTNFGVDVK